MNICIYGAASNLIAEEFKQFTFELGKRLAERGHTLIFGAGANGVMGASARGFKAGNGKIIGIVPNFFRETKIEELFEECTETIFTDDMYERKFLLEDKADAFVIAPGGIGTFDEFFAVLTNKQLGRHTKPIAMFNVLGYYDPMRELMSGAIKSNFIRPNCEKLYSFFDENQIDEMIDYLENHLDDEMLDDLKDG